MRPTHFTFDGLSDGIWSTIVRTSKNGQTEKISGFFRTHILTEALPQLRALWHTTCSCGIPRRLGYALASTRYHPYTGSELVHVTPFDGNAIGMWRIAQTATYADGNLALIHVQFHFRHKLHMEPIVVFPRHPEYVQYFPGGRGDHEDYGFVEDPVVPDHDRLIHYAARMWNVDI